MAKAFRVERRGRKRKPGPRYPSGDLVSDKEVLVARIIAFRQPHRQGAPESNRHDPKACWPLGILCLNNVITEEMYQAGVNYGATVRRYRAHYLADVPDPSPASIAGFMQPSGSRGPGDVDAGKIKDAYNSAVEALMDAGQKAARTVARMAVFGESCPVGCGGHLLAGLSKLVSHYGLTRRNK